MIRGIRGATTASENTVQSVLSSAEELYKKMAADNQIVPEKVSSVLVTVTKDLDAAFPAKALRELTGWNHVPVMCMAEIDVPGALQKCIRVMMHVETDLNQNEVQHVYLKGASVLRPDLTNSRQESSPLTE
ncbi:chorismate mutase [Bacillus sp. FJAT-42376]|uniref:chorismate mutase n=1 Tax=Bacillus sp. FJAT-42376 TaxID=2014076 RepID=UPI000F4DC6C9|nr:chorismate mutase [Bacillus sp. FJAT-42376]AZB43334.1 chorismate mutase [Bacillus sp. FJAT-42376]